jgi:type I restriction enzyme S subunit
MSSKEWKTYKLGELGVLARGKSKHRPRDAAFLYGGKYPFIQTGDIKSANHKIQTYTQTYSEDGLKQSKLWDIGTICITIAANIGDSAILTIPACFPDSVIGFVVDKSKADIDFIEYLLQFYKKNIQSHAVGSVQDNINLGTFENIVFSIPDIHTQQRIASILSSLDDKIELNRQTNQTLEGITQTLFQEMCVPKGEELPEGWRIGKLGEIIKIKHGYAFKGEFFSEEETEDILLTPGNFKIGGGFNYSKFKYYKGDIPKDYILTENDLVVTMTDLSKEGDTLGYSALVPTIQNKQLLHNQRVGKIEYKGNEYLKFFLYFTMREKDYRNFVLGSATGTTVRHTSPDRICDYNLSIPDNKTIIKFSEIVKPMLDNILSNEQETQTLIALRDSLLPKLMKGEIEI